jgi:hypothetical protein
MIETERPPESEHGISNGQSNKTVEEDARHRYPTPISPHREEVSREDSQALNGTAHLSGPHRSKEEQDAAAAYTQVNGMRNIRENAGFSRNSATSESLAGPPGLAQRRQHSGIGQDAGKLPDTDDSAAGNERPSWHESHKRKQSQVDAIDLEGKEKLLKLSPENLHVLTSDPGSMHLLVPRDVSMAPLGSEQSMSEEEPSPRNEPFDKLAPRLSVDTSNGIFQPPVSPVNFSTTGAHPNKALCPTGLSRALSTPSSTKPQQSSQKPDNLTSTTVRKPRDAPGMLRFDSHAQNLKPSALSPAMASPLLTSIPLPPLSIPTYLQLELSSHRPSPLYIHRSASNDFPYESSKVKIERLLNFMWLYPQLEGVLWFGTLACFDSWLYTFTILPLRLVRSFYMLSQSWASNLASEITFVSGFVYTGTGRMLRRRRTRGNSVAPTASEHDGVPPNPATSSGDVLDKPKSSRHHRRAKSVPSALLPDDKADMLKGLLIICTCVILLRLDASKMYHWIRGQAAIKLYVIYNVLEVSDRLLSAIGQDVLECLFSREALERKPDGHSKILRPLWLFALALVYTVTHATSLFYQVITLNVAVNSYSNALITLLMSNQFVEIKSAVFKKFEKENLFQLTCADVVERFQLWLMLTIIASRNIVETGGLTAGFTMLTSSTSGTSAPALNASNPLTQAMPPGSSSSILPLSFTILPTLVSSVTAYAPAVGHVLGPFLIVLGSEMFVDWLKHAYIGKFNNTRPAIYGRFLDVLAKDYYTNAFGEQNLTKRLGLPVVPLSCLFIRAGVQTYQMFVAAWVPSPIPSASSGLTSVHDHYASTRASQPTSTTAAISQRFDDLLKQMPTAITSSTAYLHFNTILFFALGFLVLLAVKLVLGILLLSFARSRYRSMKERERQPLHHVEGGRRVGGWGVVEVDADKRRWIYDDDAAGLQALREREERDKAKREKGTGNTFDKVQRYEMVAKRIW